MVKCHACDGKGCFDQYEMCLYCEGSGIQEMREENTMKFFEIHSPYYALLKAETQEEAVTKYTECVADNDGTLHEEIREVDRDYALVKFASGGVEGGEKMTVKEMLKVFNENLNDVLCIDSALL